MSLFHYVGDSSDDVDGSIGNTNIKMVIWTIIKKYEMINDIVFN